MPKPPDPSGRRQGSESRAETPATLTPPDPSPATASPPPASHEIVGPRPEQEPDLGRAVHELILARHKVVDDSALLERLRGAAASLAGRASESDLDLRFTVLDSEGVFAFSHPGGYLYVSRGLFNFVRDDVELQFVVGRELALLEARHLEQRASSQAQESAARAGTPIDLARRLYHQIAAGYADDQVFDADARADLALRRLGHPAYRAESFLRRYINYAADDEPGPARRRPSTSLLDDRQEIENHWRSQPPARMRYERLRTLDASSDRGSPGSSATAP
jgi:predicted Zn-dependent protease